MRLLHADETRIIIGFDPKDQMFVSVPELGEGIQKIEVRRDGIEFFVHKGSWVKVPGKKKVVQWIDKLRKKTLDYRDFLVQNWAYHYIHDAPHPTLEDVEKCDCDCADKDKNRKL